VFEFQPEPIERARLLHAEGRPPAYDILVSFDSLPENGLPSSQLGTYARRVSYGRPTIELGFPHGLAIDKRSLTFDDYFESEFFAHSVVHEFGHALGLAHTHQHPRRRLELASPAEIVERARRKLDVDVSEDEIRREIYEPWPGSYQFSDWGEPPDATTKSAMLNPWIRSFLASDEGETPAAFFAEPQPYDIALIRKLYPQALQRA
jgi:hypothetical protein